MNKFIFIFVFIFTVTIYSENLYMDSIFTRTNPSANAFDNYSKMSFLYNYETENSFFSVSTPFLFLNIDFATEYNKSLDKLLYNLSASMPLGEHLSIGGSYLYHDENSFASLGSTFRTPWFYLGYTYNFNDNIIEGESVFNTLNNHSIQLGALIFSKISPFGTINKSESEWNFTAGLSLLDVYGFDLSYEYSKINKENKHFVNISMSLPNLKMGLTTSNDALSSSYVSINLKRNKNVVFETSEYWLKIKLDGPLTEIAKGGFIDGSNYSFIDLLTILRKSVKDDYIKGIIFEIDKPSLSTSQAEELLNILNKGNKKFRVYLKMNSLGDYLLASYAEKSAIHPAVDLNIQGPSITRMFFSNLFLLSGTKAYFFKRENYKTAPEEYTHSAPSKYSLEQMDKLFSGIKNYIESTLKTSKKLNNISDILDNAPYSALKAVKLSLIDEFSYLDEFEEELIKNGIELITPAVYNDLFTQNIKISYKNKIAVLAIEGPIMETKGVLFGISENYRKKILNSIKDISIDPFVDGVIVRINSPGGSGFVSDEIHHAIKQLRKRKPVYVSIANMGASGGYYISVAGEKIFANKMSIVGSIGVFQGKFVIVDLLKRFMLGVFTKSIWKNGNLMSIFDKLSESQIKKMDESVEDFYQLFLKRVGDGRDLKITKVKEIAQGKVYLGQESKKIKLIDEIGGFYDAIDSLNLDNELSGELVIEAYPKSDVFLLNLLTGEKKLLFKINTMVNLINTPDLLLSDYEIDF